ncbi:MAG: hypothetical protein ACUVT7_03845 [Thermoplasmata archaeon]
MLCRLAAKSLVLAIAVVLVTVALSATVPNARAAWTYFWDDETPLGAPASQAVVVGAQNGTVYIMGGVRDATYLRVADAYSYDPDTGDWTVLAPMPVAERGAAGAIGLDGRVYVFGGDDGSGYTQIYDPGADSWSLGTAMPYPVWEGKAACVGNGSIWVVGGEGAPTPGLAQIYDPVADSWSIGTPAPADVLCGAMVSVGNDLYYSGGGDGDYTGTTNFFKYDSALGDWIALADLPYGRAAHAMVVGVDGLMYIVGGSDSGWNWPGVTYNYVEAYDPVADEWLDPPDMVVSRTYLGATVTPDGRILALGGNSESEILNVVESLQLYTFEYSMELSASSVRAGESVLLNMSATFEYIEEYGCEFRWYLMSDVDGTIYNSGGMSVPLPEALSVTVSVPVLTPPGQYVVLVDYWYIYADNADELIEMQEFPLEVLPAPPPADELIAALEAEIADLQSQIDELNASLQSGDAELMAEIGALENQVASLEDALEALEESVATSNQNMIDEIAALQDQIDALQEQLDDVETTSSSGSMWGMVNLVLLIIVIMLLVTMFLMSRKGRAPPPPGA